MSSTTHGLPLATWHAEISRLGFEPAGTEYRRAGFSLRADQGWLTLQAQDAPDLDPDLCAPLGQPGFWRLLPCRGAISRVFELPAFVLGPDEDDELLVNASDSSLGQSLIWALQTAEGAETLPAWEPPARQDIESWLPPGGMTVLVGGSVVQGELIAAPGRLALRFLLSAGLPMTLDETRRAWLRAVLHDAQRLTWLVRLGLTEEGDQRAVMAEVDLSYAPPAVCERLLLVSLESLRWVAGQLAETVAFIVDPAAAAVALLAPPE